MYAVFYNVMLEVDTGEIPEMQKSLTCPYMEHNFNTIFTMEGTD